MMAKLKNLKASRQKMFILLAFLMFAVTLLLIIYFVTSLANGINATLRLPPTPTQNVRFDIQGFKKLNLTQQ